MQEKDQSKKDIELSIVMPCLNELETIGICIRKAKTFLAENQVSGEIVVSDNGSTDGSDKLARELGARVVYEKEKGYGSALMKGISEAKGKYIIMGDSDDSYDFLSIKPFLDKLRRGNDLVMGNRFAGGLQKGAMPFLNKYIGNPFLSGIGKLFFKSKVSDFHCGLRGFSKEAYKKMNMQTKGMEFASEMVVKATLLKMNIAEVPTTLSQDGRSRRPHLRPFNDGWRHLRFLLLYSPRWLFLYPGIALFVIGLILSLWIFFRVDQKIDVHSMLYSAAAVIIGIQLFTLSIYSKVFAFHEGLIPENPFIDRMISKFSLEKGLFFGGFILAIGIAIGIYTFIVWQEGTFFDMGIRITLRYVILSFLFIILGFHTIISSFFFSFLKIN